jgi:hypothetical protein
VKVSGTKLTGLRTIGSSERCRLVGVLGTTAVLPAALLVFFSRVAACLIIFFADARASSSS